MLVLDTNVVSELMRPAPDPGVVAWVDDHPADDLAITAMTVAELLAGVAVLPAGARRERLGERVAELVGLFDERVLAFDGLAAVEYAGMVERRRRAGTPISTADAIVAACCRATGADLATRNTRDFAGTGVRVVDPWTAGAV